MSAPTQPHPPAGSAAVRGRRQARVMRAMNVPMRAVLGLPFATPLSGRLMLLHYTGRRTGHHYRQPLSYVRDGDVLLTPGGGRWTLSLTDGEPVTIRLRGRDQRFAPELVGDPERVAALLVLMAVRNPAMSRFVPLPHRSDGSLQPEPLQAAVRHGFRVVRWHPVD